MKKLLTLTLALILTLSICACTAEPTDTPAVTTDGVSDTATETAADTETETEFVPTEDNVIWAKYDVIRRSGNQVRDVEIFIHGEVFVYDFIMQKMKTSGDKRIAVRYGYYDGIGTSRDIISEDDEIIPVHGYLDKETKLYAYAFLTADEIEELVSKMNDFLKEKPEAGFTLIPFTYAMYKGEGGVFAHDVLTTYRYLYGKDSERYKNEYNFKVNEANIPGGYKYPEEDHED